MRISSAEILVIHAIFGMVSSPTQEGGFPHVGILPTERDTFHHRQKRALRRRLLAPIWLQRWAAIFSQLMAKPNEIIKFEHYQLSWLLLSL
jgi:hypothetical protein